MTTGDRIKLRREELGITRAELARRVGYTRSAITKLETKGNITVSKLADFANALNTTVADLVSNEELEDDFAKEAIERFRKLDSVDKSRILERMDTMLEAEKYKATKA